MKIRTADLTGAQLDYHTARAQGIPAERLQIRRVPRTDTLICVKKADKIGSFDEGAAYSTDWHLAGALLEQHIMDVESPNTKVEDWIASMYVLKAGYRIFCYGPTPQVAICRAVVRAAFGDEVEEVAVC